MWVRYLKIKSKTSSIDQSRIVVSIGQISHDSLSLVYYCFKNLVIAGIFKQLHDMGISFLIVLLKIQHLMVSRDRYRLLVLLFTLSSNCCLRMFLSKQSESDDVYFVNRCFVLGTTIPRSNVNMNSWSDVFGGFFYSSDQIGNEYE